MESIKRTALIYDFDGTLAPGNLQEHSFLPRIGIERDAFWSEVKERTKKFNADEILVYMQLMIEKSKLANKPITIPELNKHGERAELFPGLSDFSWFDRVNKYGHDNDLHIEHYIISSSIQEMIDGCRIRNAFKIVFASKFIYENDIAVWPSVGVNYTTKTQYLFRINKGIDNHWDNEKINAYTPKRKRPIPFERMIFLGDGLTDIPTMKMLTLNGGHSVAVYDSKRSKEDLSKIHRLISDDRVNYVAPADYSENSSLDIIVKGVLGRIAQMQDCCVDV